MKSSPVVETLEIAKHDDRGPLRYPLSQASQLTFTTKNFAKNFG
jgi:hypothetical protein